MQALYYSLFLIGVAFKILIASFAHDQNHHSHGDGHASAGQDTHGESGHNSRRLGGGMDREETLNDTGFLLAGAMMMSQFLILTVKHLHRGFSYMRRRDRVKFFMRILLSLCHGAVPVFSWISGLYSVRFLIWSHVALLSPALLLDLAKFRHTRARSQSEQVPQEVMMASILEG